LATLRGTETISALQPSAKRCGKTTLLSLLHELTCRPLAAANLTPAVAFRVIEAAQPKLRRSLERACRARPWRIAETGMKPAPLPRSPWLDGI